MKVKNLDWSFDMGLNRENYVRVTVSVFSRIALTMSVWNQDPKIYNWQTQQHFSLKALVSRNVSLLPNPHISLGSRLFKVQDTLEIYFVLNENMLFFLWFTTHYSYQLIISVDSVPPFQLWASHFLWSDKSLWRLPYCMPNVSTHKMRLHTVQISQALK